MKSFALLFFYLLILFLPTQLGRHFFPSFSFVSGIRTDYLAPTIYASDVLIFLIFVFWIASTKKFLISNFKFLINPKFLISKSSIIVLVLVLIIGILLSKSPQAGVYGFIKLLEFIFLGFYTAHNFKKLRFNTVLVLFSTGIIFESFLAIFQYINQTSIGGIFYWFGERTFNAQTPGIANASVNGELILRPYATFSHPNVLAGYLLIGMVLILGRIMNHESRIKRIVFILTLTIGTIVLFLTLSRIVILIWLITLGIFLFLKFLNHKSYILILLGSLLILGLATPLGARFTELKLTDESIVVRQQLIKSSLLMIKENPFLGVGLNNFLVELPEYQKINNYFTDLQPVHNIYLLILAQTGIVGFVFFIWFMFKTYQNVKCQMSNVKSASKNLKSKKKNELVISNWSLVISLSSILILGLFDHYFLTLQQGQLLLSFVLGLCWVKRDAKSANSLS